MDDQLTMSVRDIAAVVHARRLGELPVLLRSEPVWTDEDTDQRARTVRLDEETLEGLYTLAHPAFEYGAFIRTDTQYRSVFVAERGRCVVVAERMADVLTMTTAHDRSALAELVQHIPDATAATIEAVNLRRSDVASRRGKAVDFELGAGPQGRDFRTVATLSGRPLMGQGELYVGAHDQFGRVAISKPVRYQDYDLGRVLVVVSDDFVSLAPATKPALTRRLTEERQCITRALSR